MIVTGWAAGDCGQKQREKKRGDLASKGFDPCPEPVQAFGRTKDSRGAKERGSGHPQKFTSQNEGLIAGAISLRTLRCRVALNIHTYIRLCTCMRACVYVCMCNPRGSLRASPRSKTSPARLHRSFASSRCFITMALGSPLALLLPSRSTACMVGDVVPWKVRWNSTRAAQWRLRESRFGKVASPNRNPENSPRKSASNYPLFFSKWESSCAKNKNRGIISWRVSIDVAVSAWENDKWPRLDDDLVYNNESV